MMNGNKNSLRAPLFWAFVAGLGLWSGRPAQAIDFTAGPVLTNSAITTENPLSASSGTAVQFTLDTAGTVELDIYLISPIDSSLTQVAAVTRSFTGGTPQVFPWDGMWLIGTEFARHNGKYAYQVVPSTGGAAGTGLPPFRDPSSFFTIDSVDIHNLVVSPSFDAAQQPTFPYLISYALSKTSIVTGTIVNSSGTVVRTFPAQRQAGESISSATITWNGLSTDGTPAPIGSYTVKINATDPNSGDPAKERSATLDVFSLAGAASNPQKLFEDNVYVFPHPVRNGLGTFKMQAIRDGANLSLKIYTISGDLVFQQDFPAIPAGNIVTFPWNTVNQGGRKVGRGLYYYVVREEDTVGTLQTTKKMAVLP